MSRRLVTAEQDGTAVQPASLEARFDSYEPVAQDTGNLVFVPVEFADSGNVPILPNDKGVGYLRMYRIGPWVTVGADGGLGYLEGPNALDAPAGSWPLGFRPRSVAYISLSFGNLLAVYPNGSWHLYAQPDQTLDDAACPTTTWATDDPFTAYTPNP